MSAADRRKQQIQLTEGLVGLPQSLREYPHDLQRKIRGLTHEKQKLLFRNSDQLHIGGGDGGCAARLVDDKRHLAENGMGYKLCDGHVADLNPNVPSVDD